MENSPPPPSCAGCKDRDAIIAALQTSLNEMHIRAVDAEAGFPCIDERDATIASLCSNRGDLLARNAAWMEWSKGLVGMQASDADARLAIAGLTDKRVDSIVAFHYAEANRFDRAASTFDATGSDDAAERCRMKAGHTRCLAAQIARGDDLRGGE